MRVIPRVATLSPTSKVVENPIHSLLNCWPEMLLPNLIAFKSMDFWKRNQFKQSSYQVPNKALLVKNLRKHDPLSRCNTTTPSSDQGLFSSFFAFSLINTSLKEDLSKSRCKRWNSFNFVQLLNLFQYVV